MEFPRRQTKTCYHQAEMCHLTFIIRVSLSAFKCLGTEDGDLDAPSPSPNSFKSSFLIQRLAPQELMYLSSYAHGQTPGKILCSSQITKSLFSQQVAHLNRGSLSGEVMGTKEGEGTQLGSRGPRGRSPTCNSKPAHLPHLLAFSFSVKAQSVSVEGGKG